MLVISINMGLRVSRVQPLPITYTFNHVYFRSLLLEHILPKNVHSILWAYYSIQCAATELQEYNQHIDHQKKVQLYDHVFILVTENPHIVFDLDQFFKEEQEPMIGYVAYMAHRDKLTVNEPFITQIQRFLRVMTNNQQDPRLDRHDISDEFGKTVMENLYKNKDGICNLCDYEFLEIIISWMPAPQPSLLVRV